MMSSRTLIVSDKLFKSAIGRRGDLSFDPGFASAGRDTTTNRNVEWVNIKDYKCFAVDPAVRNGKQSWVSSFFWGLYDQVLLQDLYEAAESPAQPLEWLPLCVAHHLYFGRGQFGLLQNTIVRPVVVDPNLTDILLCNGALSPADGPSDGLRQRRSALVSALDQAGFWREWPSVVNTARPASGAKANVRIPPSGVTQAVDELLTRIENGEIHLWMVDDNRAWLEPLAKALRLDVEVVPGGHEGGLWILDVSSRQAQLHGCPVDEVDEFLAIQLENAKCNLRVVIVDILFQQHRHRTGLHVIESIRKCDVDLIPRTIVIACTGYGNPLVTAACHAAQADFVVQKAAAGLYAHGGLQADLPSALLELCWDILWLRAICGYASARFSTIVSSIKHSRREENFRGLVDDARRDIDRIFPTSLWFPSVKSWRKMLGDLLEELGVYASIVLGPQERQRGEVERWRLELLQRAGNLPEIPDKVDP